ncbi:sulfatase-like hydrolase/transferase [Flavicella sediminum]|uniref:sulfatase-like hydrolase/transferase n=1 Tax=Flavicella sediminum TaxID=2585141 RepID=UPI00111E8EAF|nr:sulfatase-like hydrolase/transferase [Flavicella sediminum]
MNIKHQIVFFTLLISAVTFGQSTTNTRPNIILIVADDLGYGDVGFNRATNAEAFPADRGIIPTPQLDVLANSGIICKNAHVAHPFCGPSRAALLTGMYPHRIGAQYNLPNDITSELGIPTSETYFPKVLQNNNYNTAAFGKWHLGFKEGAFQPLDRGFDYFFGFLGGGKGYFENGYEDNFYNRLNGSNPVTNEYQDPLQRNRSYVDRNEFSNAVDEDYLTDILTDDAITYMNANSGDSDPFFMYLSYNAPHTPLEAPSDEIAAFKAANPDFENLVRNSTYLTEANQVTKWPEEEQAAKIEEFVADRITYATMVTNLDTNIGRLVAELKKDMLVYNNTVIIFISDNGGYTYSKGAVNFPLDALKGSVLEGGHRVPMFVHWPNKITSPAIYNKQISALDIYPTLIDLAGGSVPTGKTIDGKNFMDDLIVGQGIRPDGEPIYVMRPQNGFHNAAVISYPWKIVKTATNGSWRLYNIVTDPGESTDVSGTETNAETIIQDLLDQAVVVVKDFKDEKPAWFDNDGDGSGHAHSGFWNDGTLPAYDQLFGSAQLQLESALSEVFVEGTTNGIEALSNGLFTVRLPEGAVASENIVVQFSVSGSAIEGVDYENLSGAVTILEGNNSVSIPIVVLEDALEEGVETIEITLSSTSLGSVNTTAAQITITDEASGTPTILTAGDIAFVGYNSSEGAAEHDFAFMLLKDISPNTSISFCDRGWKAPGGWLVSGSGSAFSVDDTVTWTADRSYSSGTIIRINQSKAYVGTSEIGTDAVTQDQGSGYMNFNANGDVLYAYQGSEPADEADVSKFIAVLGMNGQLCVGGGNTAGCKPSNLTLGINAIEIDPELNNAVYKGKIVGGLSQLRAAIHNPANWDTSDTTVYELHSYSSGGSIGVSGNLAVASFSLEKSSSVFPNPAKNKIYVRLKKGVEIKEVRLLNFSSAVLKKTNQSSLDISEFPAGMYFLVIETNSGQVVKKVIKA